ncbi:MAG TPA: hypothetical protein VKY89_24585 [Thermoanaerobaculia bacterium]|jgi:hypothetical protein|nr:hypothetical protein [Thermoanaerobaculia bacterium]
MIPWNCLRACSPTTASAPRQPASILSWHRRDAVSALCAHGAKAAQQVQLEGAQRADVGAHPPVVVARRGRQERRHLQRLGEHRDGVGALG